VVIMRGIFAKYACNSCFQEFENLKELEKHYRENHFSYTQTTLDKNL